MKAVVLAGGYATRLWPITRHRPKMFLPLGERTVIDRLYTELEAADRLDTVYVSTNERFAPDFEAHLADRPYEKPQLSIEETREEGEKFGVVGALEELIDREGIDDDLLVIAGDNVFDFAIESFLAFFDRRDAPTIAAYDVGEPERAGGYGVVELEGDRVVDFVEKPDDPPGTRVSIGCYAFPRETLSLLSTCLEAGNDPDEPGRFVEWLYDREPTYAYAFDGAWFDVGTRESYLDAVSWRLGGDSLVADSASLETVAVGSNVHVMAEASLVDAELERAVIFPEVTLAGTTVRRSIVDEGATLEGLDLADAMVGAHTRIPDGSRE
ncbi:Nucleoside-diphosphate-sugar pyrophosphorylase family protein [Halovivax ruber XH-70]|uniref:Nucleoside-diphosphate-sugar pyrophosphorylase family protein n=1 Tax=Halovivax ruber (strain DSM 18193 / JCM 13892 / XH-70) TaxID=797302 RepID=L0IHR8_HALRX|nr:NDP-sugar synthase [Halovivax ruber]AGB17532.1 Nucleoside-diphosphate-sugar pyrophosphorylase family protein [Halovivax ruber XH-70]